MQIDPPLELQLGDVGRLAEALEVALEYPLELALVLHRVHDEGAQNRAAHVALDQVAEVAILGGLTDQPHVLADRAQGRSAEPVLVALDVFHLQISSHFEVAII